MLIVCDGEVLLLWYQADELIKALSDLENSASSDAAVRERIAALPPEVSDVSLLEKLSGTSVLLFRNTGHLKCSGALRFFDILYA